MNASESSNVEFAISGLRCGGCVDAVVRALEGVPGVERCEVDLESGRAKISGTAPDSLLKAAVREAGYEA